MDVQGTTIGKGFAGVIKRHHFSSNRETHGNSITTRTQGSTGQRQDPGRVFPGKRMAGHLGNVKRTTQNLVVVRIDAERQLLLVKGSVPGFSGRDVIVRPAVKGQKKVVAQKPAPDQKQGREGEGLTMELKLINDKGAAGTMAAKDEIFGARLQRGAGAPARGLLCGQRAPGARASRRTAAKCAIRPRSPGARRAPAARAPA